VSVLTTSPEANRIFNMEIATALGSMDSAIILQQLHYWTKKKGIGVIVDNAKYIYNTFKDWVNQQFPVLTEWKFRKAMNVLRSLEIVDVIRYKEKQWNQTNYYSLNYKKLREWAEAESLEISEMCPTSPQGGENQTLEIENPSTSYKETKNTSQRSTAKQASARSTKKPDPSAAATSKEALREEKNQTGRNPHSDGLNASPSQIKQELEQKESNIGKEKSYAKVDHIVNKQWKELIPLLDSAGIPINRTIKDLLKLYPSEKVESAINILKERRREKHIPNLSGYFVAALKGDWESQSPVVEESGDNAADKGAVFRYWYDLAKSLGYCSGQEVREGEQWVNLSGSWEKWESAIERGYSLEYLKKILKRNKS